jgi:hypothetical protein
MKKYLLLSIATLTLASGVALAQTPSYQSSTTTTTTSDVPTVPPEITPPPPGTLSRTEVTKTTDGMGNTTYTRKTIYGNATGAVSQSATTTITQPPVVQQTYKRTTTTTTSSSPN